MKPLDISKFKRGVTKSLGIVDGYHDPKIWISTGNHAINKLISGSYYKGIPLGKVTVIAGESGSGKSFLTCGNVAKHAIKDDVLVIILDSEFSIDAEWLKNAGIDPDSPNIIRYPVGLVDDCASIINTFMMQYLEEYGNEDYDNRPRVLFVIDSLGMLSTPTELEQFRKNDMKGDMGRKAKQLKAFVTQCLKLFGPHPVGMIATNHVYVSQDAYSPDDIISGGSGFIFASSIIATLNKYKLKEDQDGNKSKDTSGIRAKMKVIKTRFSKPFEEIEVHIPYNLGLTPYTGLFDYFEKKNMLKKNGNRYEYTYDDGEKVNLFRKEWNNPDNAKYFDRIMKETDEKDDDLTFDNNGEVDELVQ